MHHIVIYCLPNSTIFSTSFHKKTYFQQKKVIEKKMCFDFLYKII